MEGALITILMDTFQVTMGGGDKGKKHKGGNSESAQVLKSNRMGMALCFLNPMEDSLLRGECQRLEIAKAKRNMALFQVQKNFLVTQFLEKGLNPCMAPKHTRSDRQRQKLLRGRSVPGRANLGSGSQYQVVSVQEGLGNQSRAVSKTQKGALGADGESREQSALKLSAMGTRGQTGSAATRDGLHREGLKDKWDFSTFSKKEDSDLTKLPQISDALYRNPTQLCIKLPLKRNDLHGRELPPLTGNLHMTDVPEHTSETSSEKPSVHTKSTTPDSRRTPSLKEKRTIEYLRNHPDELFPRMKVLLQQKALEDELDEKVNADDNLKDDDDQINMDKDGMDESLDGKQRDGETTKYIKMIQKIMAFLPPHLATTAKDQVREMCDSDAIQAHKAKLLEMTKQGMQREVLFADDRWKVLQENLSSTHGLNSQWRKIYTNKWQQGEASVKATQNDKYGPY